MTLFSTKILQVYKFRISVKGKKHLPKDRLGVDRAMTWIKPKIGVGRATSRLVLARLNSESQNELENLVEFTPNFVFLQIFVQYIFVI